MDFGSWCVHSWHSSLAAFPNFNLFFFRFFCLVCLFQHFIIWIPLQIRNRQDELKCRVDTLRVLFLVFSWFLILTVRQGAWSIWPSLLCMNSRYHCPFFCPPWQMCSFSYQPLGYFIPLQPCIHFSQPYKYQRTAKNKTSVCKIIFAYPISLISCIFIPEINLMPLPGIEERVGMVVIIFGTGN